MPHDLMERSPMKLKCAFSVLATFAFLAWTLPVSAQWVVVDPANLVENTFTAARELTQIENQITELQNEAQMLINEAKNLTSLNYSSLGTLRALLATTQRLLNQAQGLSYQLAAVQQQYARLYPENYNPGTSFDQLNQDSLTRWLDSHRALDTTLQMQAQANMNFPQDEAVLSDIVDSSQSAVGALQAIQSTNQLLALQARQNIQIQHLAIAQDRAAALEQARAVEADARARELRRAFMTQATKYTPQNINVN
jgi:type IV secretion system protein TrbJ